jgi:seryl-tRNA synthetase
MIDIDIIRNNPDVVKKDLKKRGMNERAALVDEIRANDKEWRELKGELDSLRAQRNKISEEINEAKKSGKDVK